MTLDDVIGAAGAAEIASIGAIRFHAVGDTGRPGHNDQQQAVADDMTLDYQPAAAGNNPAFFLHLGDVIYGPNKDQMYRDEFYRPYMHYPGKIIAIPGNHDGEVFAASDRESLQAYLANFCAANPAVPAAAQQVGILRQMVAQPGAYWWLNAPFVDLIGLYSNVLEGPGALVGQGGDTSQKDWLVKTLREIAATRKSSGASKALIIATHHPPFSSSGHSGSPQMLADIDDTCNTAGIIYDAVLSGHAHNYQRYTRRVNFNGVAREIPFVVAGGGGHGAQAVKDAYGQPDGDHTYESALGDYGYVLVTVSTTLLKIDMWQVSTAASNRPFDSVTVNLQTHQER
jgi:calcineurin-like phosphoesterase family protein